MPRAGSESNPVASPRRTPPLWLNAEVTYRCPLHCVFCYNPVAYADAGPELTTLEWHRVFQQARELGAVQLGLSGGEPLGRDDLESLIGEANRLGYYINLITSGVGLTEARVAAFKEAGLHHIQLSFQDSTRELNDFLSSTRTFERKLRVAEWVKRYEFPMVLNVVLHRMNIEHVQQILEMADELGAEHVELANTQYYGWAFQNRDELLPGLAQVERAEAVVREFRKRVGNRMKIYFVVPDYHSDRPKKCVNGWGTTLLNITPDGVALPCHEARMLPGLSFPSVQRHDIRWIWEESPAFNHFRGNAWMKEPCRSCPEQQNDLGGCRCQAFMLTGDAANADPVCELSPDHHLITASVQQAAARQEAAAQEEAATQQAPARRSLPLVFRSDENSRRLSSLAERGK